MNYKYSRFGACILIFLFPSLCNVVEHSGSIVLGLLTILGFAIALSPKKRPPIARHEKWVIGVFAAYFGVHLLSLVINGLLGNITTPRIKDIEHEFHFLSFLPAFLFLRYMKIPQGALWGAITTGAIIAGGYAICSALWLLPGGRVSGGYDPIAFGDISMALAFMSIVSLDWFRRDRKYLIFLSFSALVMGVVASILSETRGAWIAIPGLLCVCYFYFAKFVRMGPRLLMAGLCCALLVAAYKIPATKIEDRLDLIMTEIADYTEGKRAYTSTNTRIEGWRAALDIYYRFPILGAGPESYAPLLHEMVAKGKPYQNATPHGLPHSTYLTVMAECGTFGLIVLLPILALPLWLAVIFIRTGDKVRDVGYALVMLVIAFTHFGLTETIFGRNVYINFYVVMVASLLAVAANEKGISKECNDRRPIV